MGLMAQADRTLTTEDVALLDKTSMARSGRGSRLAGSILVGVGVVIAMGWAWSTVRAQQNLADFRFGADPTASASFADRVDLAVSGLGILALAGVLVGVGFLLRLLGDHVAFAAGASPLGFAVGDPWPLAESRESGADPEPDESPADDVGEDDDEDG